MQIITHILYMLLPVESNTINYRHELFCAFLLIDDVWQAYVVADSFQTLMINSTYEAYLFSSYYNHYMNIINETVVWRISRFQFIQIIIILISRPIIKIWRSYFYYSLILPTYIHLRFFIIWLFYWMISPIDLWFYYQHKWYYE